MFKTTLVLAALVVCAVVVAPAYTADNGFVFATVRAQGAPCIQLSQTSLDYGTVPFAQPGSASAPPDTNNRADSTVTNCGTDDSLFFVAGSDSYADGASQWALTDNWYTCDGTINKFGVLYDQHFGSSFYTQSYLVTAYRELQHYANPVVGGLDTNRYTPGESVVATFALHMPCVGSARAGLPTFFNVYLLASLA
jgi:hypothetical protein